METAIRTGTGFGGVWFLCVTSNGRGYGDWGRGRTIEEAEKNTPRKWFKNRTVVKVTQREDAPEAPCIGGMGGPQWWPGEDDHASPVVAKYRNGKPVESK
jgi:hypothetical protein